ncbi:thioredoxin-like protein [Xylariaceae sp. FL0016]|nr:thioredoxin-like protein [Xylariaceae sp. FL0016]
MYESEIVFTLDTVCPWTYLAKKRLDAALSKYSSSSPPSAVHFTLRFAPYQLYPSMACETSEDKRAWYTREKFAGSDETMQKFETVMRAHGDGAGIAFDFGGVTAGTLDAHRVVYYFQGHGTGGDDDDDDDDVSDERREMAAKYGPRTASKIVDALYAAYFEQRKHPSSEETLLEACVLAGVEEGEARRVVRDKNVGLRDVQLRLRRVVADGVDSVPSVVIEGRKRDITLVGAKELVEYEKALATIARESV